MIPYGKQDISQQDIDEVVATLASDFLTQGPKIPQFERAIADICDAPYACAVSNATAALHIACLALELGPTDILWTSPITFVASANVGLYCQATVDFVDVEPDTGLMCPEALAIKLAKAKAENKLPKILIPVHLGGQSCDMAAIHQLCRQYDIKIIEDASHAIGAKYQDQPVGNCRFSDISVFSFHPVKIMTTAEGGIATTKDKAIANKLALLRSHGTTRDEDLFTEPSHGPWYYQQIDLGFNYRITDLQAALGYSQSQRLTEFIAARQQRVATYNQLIADLPIKHLRQLADNYSSYHLYVILTDNKKLQRKTLFEHLRAKGVGVNVHYIPVHLQPYYQQLGFKQGDFLGAEDYYARAITLPLFPLLTEQEQKYVVSCITELL